MSIRVAALSDIPVYTHTAVIVGSILIVVGFLAVLTALTVTWLRHR
jgi:hypothetical protein